MIALLAVLLLATAPVAASECEGPGHVLSIGAVLTGEVLVNAAPIAVVEGQWPTAAPVGVASVACRETAISSGGRTAAYPPAAQDPRMTGRWTAGGGAKGACDAPLYLLVTAEVRDAPRLGTYRAKLAETGIMYAYGAVDILAGPPAKVLSGDWPATFNAKVTRWPCRAAFDAFFNSDQYQKEIKPLRDGAAEFTALLLPAAR